MIDRIKHLMEINHTHKATFLKELGISHGNFSDWESGRSAPKIDKLIKIADHFAVSLDYLTGRDDRFPTMSQDGFELIRIYESQDKEGKTIILASAYLQKQRLEATAESKVD